MALLLAVPVAAQSAAADVDTGAAQRERIERERALVERESQAAQAACASQFAVTACIDRAKAERRRRLQELDRQRAVLDDDARKRRAADRIERIRQRQAGAADAQPSLTVRARTPAADAADAVGPADGTASAGNGRPATRPSAAASAAREAAEAQAESNAAQRAAAAAGRASAAAAHRRAIEKRSEERKARKGRPAAPLPVPGAASRVLP